MSMARGEYCPSRPPISKVRKLPWPPLEIADPRLTSSSCSTILMLSDGLRAACQQCTLLRTCLADHNHSAQPSAGYGTHRSRALSGALPVQDALGGAGEASERVADPVGPLQVAHAAQRGRACVHAPGPPSHDTEIPPLFLRRPATTDRTSRYRGRFRRVHLEVRGGALTAPARQVPINPSEPGRH